MHDDTIVPFSPGDIDSEFDDIEPEPEPEPQEPPVPLVQARRLRASPNIQGLKRPVEKASDSNEECYHALIALRAQVRSGYLSHPPCFLHARLMCLSQFAKDHGCDADEILLEEVVQYLSAMLPSGS